MLDLNWAPMNPRARKFLRIGAFGFCLAAMGMLLAFLEFPESLAWINDVGATLLLGGIGIGFIAGPCGTAVVWAEKIRQQKK